jgi:hypothetical protein
MATSSATAVHITLLSGRSECFAVDRSTKVEELKAWAQKSFGQGDVGKKYRLMVVPFRVIVKPCYWAFISVLIYL